MNTENIKERLAQFTNSEYSTVPVCDLVRDCREALEELERYNGVLKEHIKHLNRLGTAWQPESASDLHRRQTTYHSTLLRSMKTPEQQIAELQSQLSERDADCAAMREAVGIVVEAYSFVKNGTREPVSFTMKRPENDEKVFRLVIALNNLTKKHESSTAGRELLERLQAVEKERDRYKEALVKLWLGDFVGTPINEGCGAMSVIKTALAGRQALQKDAQHEV